VRDARAPRIRRCPIRSTENLEEPPLLQEVRLGYIDGRTVKRTESVTLEELWD
jgi:hypothetical protein